ncbi:tetratricopeptide repeat-containing sensor histidine kinase [Chitinophaga sancti]|uniref:histidine kinase n=1 Tax=Chitinophaga sancti TaxID=1004 RepID=A0A1K1NB26_9BACT|nr:ATP-binding protein [Chitinophaga sancti]WQD63380.1 ATP-binding protein [Chitinophaga sancti]WQG90994.1 ATP-binding protein [Chitinophaga sancti]SFW32648.1 Signal transduction histidine kinase [Chitinophaga sancti]
MLALFFAKPVACLAQSQVTDSLTKVLATHPTKDTVRVNILNQLSRFLFTQVPSLTETYAKEAFHISDSLYYLPGKMWAIRNLALAENAKGNLEKQADLTLEALKLAEQLKDLKATGVLNADLGNIFIEQQQPRQGLIYQKKALAIKQRGNDQAEIGKTLNGIGTSYMVLKEWDSALHFLYASEKIKLALHDHRGLAYAYENIGTVLSVKGNYREALRYHSMSSQYYRESDNVQGVVKSYLNLAQTHTLLKELTAAEEDLQNANRLNKNMQNARNEMIYYKYRAMLDSARGNYAQALENYKEFHALSDEVFSAEKTKFIANSKEKYESEKKQHENELLKKEQALHLSTIRQQKIYVILFVALFMALATITVLLYRVFKRQKELYGQLNNRNRRVQQQNQIILDQNAALESGNQVKDKIFSVISHDLRAPLGILEGMLFLLRDEKMSQEQFNMFVEELWRDVKNTSAMMDNLLQWANTQMKGIRVMADDFNITALLDSEFELLQTLAKQKNIRLNHHLPSVIHVYADKDMIRMVVRNLVSNAIKFTPKNGRITVDYKLMADKVEMIVKDNGIGIAAEDQSKVFSNIYYSTTGTQNEKGCGLGLPLSKDFIQRNNGQIWFHSNKEKGTSFHFTLPLSEEEEAGTHGMTIILQKTRDYSR